MELSTTKLDNLDMKILFELDRNSRIPVTSLAKKLRISREIVKYRMSKLQNEKVVESFTTIANPAKLGYIIYKVYFKLQNLSKEKEAILIKYILGHKNVFWIAQCEGAFDLILGVYVNNLVEFNKILLEIMEHFSQNIFSRHITNTVYAEMYRRDYLTNKESEKVIWGGELENQPLDSKSKQLLKELAKNSRTTIAELSEKLKSDPKTIISKIKKLEKEKVILGYRTNVPLNKIKREYFKAIVYFQNVSSEKEESFKKYCQKNPEIVYYIETIGEWDAELDIEVENFEKFNKLVREIKENFGDLIRTVETVFISKEMKGELNIVQNL